MAPITINKILIANRGEIACRIIRTAHKLGIQCVAVYSECDEFSQHVQLADEAWYLGPSPAKQSYLLADKIIDIAVKSHADAIHPGYGFLSENADFSEACSKNNIRFIGPPKNAIVAMGSKSEAKNIMTQAQVPLVEGYHGDDQSENLLHSEANKIGYPVLIKATAGGGGKGMRIVKDTNDFINALSSCKREAISSFGDDKVLVEKYLTKPRHVEIQIFADSHGNVIHLFERDCSVQRRHQKIIEEAPAPGLSDETRTAMGQVAIDAAKAIDYCGAGTVEFLYDEDGSFYFMEMNTRLQVEHPVTEKITGLDLVEWQIIVANGLPLPLSQSEICVNGHAFEARIYAEDPDNDFLPATGIISYLSPPQENTHVRVDSGFISGDQISIYYDPMIAKLIVWDKDRTTALARLRGALRDFQVAGLTTNIEFLHQLASNQAFMNADLDTHFLDKHGDELCAITPYVNDEIAAAAALFIMLKQSPNRSGQHHSPWQEKSGWRLNQDNYHLIEFHYKENLFKIIAHFRDEGFLFEIDNKEFHVNGYLKENKIHLNIDGKQRVIHFSSNQQSIVLFNNASSWKLQMANPTDFNQEQQQVANLTAPMPGTIIDVLVCAGDTVEKDQPLIVMEAMKMEHTISAHKNTEISEVLYSIGDLVEDGAELIRFVDDE